MNVRMKKCTRLSGTAARAALADTTDPTNTIRAAYRNTRSFTLLRLENIGRSQLFVAGTVLALTAVIFAAFPVTSAFRITAAVAICARGVLDRCVVRV